jgi:8-amino-7-oxononanoate synthase
MPPLLDRYESHCRALARQGLLRSLRPPADRPVRLVDFSGNDYLGLSRHPEVVAAGCEAGRIYGAGATGSRLLSGNLEIFERFEARIAQDKGTEAALLFPTGHQANLSTIAALLDAKALGAEPLVFCDRLIHASMHQGCFLAGVREIRYSHLDLAHLESLLARHADDEKPKIILSETVFGMDGDVADAAALQEIALAHDALLYLDEAHATGVFGPRGFGLCEGLELSPSTVVMGTLSKAVGVSGGYVACSKIVRDLLVNRAGGFVFSTAPSPLATGAALKAWELIPQLSRERAELLARAERLRRGLAGLGLECGPSCTQIVPIVLGDAERTLAARDLLAERGFLVSAVRPPTVPPHTARLRLGVTAAHTDKDIEAFLAAARDI